MMNKSAKIKTAVDNIYQRPRISMLAINIATRIEAN